MTAADRGHQPRLFWSIVGGYVATWTFVSWLTSPSLDPYGDMVENYAWSQTLAWGTFKHPPLLAWIVRLWFSVFPTDVWAYYLLAYVNAAVGLLGIVALARLWLPDDFDQRRRDGVTLTVLVLAVISFPYSNLAAKFNADTILLSVWPWTAYAFFASVGATAPRDRWRFALLLGVSAAASLLGKYFSVLLLVTLAVISVSDGTFRRWYRTPVPYAAAAVFAMLVLPHALWETRMGFPMVEYVETRIDPAIDPGRVALFLLSGIYYLPLSWIAWFALRKMCGAAGQHLAASALPFRGLVLLTVLPASLTGAANVVARIHLTTHWAIPVWFALPALLALSLFLRPDIDWVRARLSRAVTVVWAAVIAGALAYTIVLSTTGNPKYSLARREMVHAVERRFAARVPAGSLSWAGGTWPESGALAFFGAGHPRALPGYPDGRLAQANPYPEWQNGYGVIVCYASGDYARLGAHDTACERDTRAWLQRHRMRIDEESLTYHADGWRFPNPPEKNVTVFWVPRAATGE